MESQLLSIRAISIFVFFSVALAGVTSEASTLLPCQYLTTKKPAPERATFVLSNEDVSTLAKKGWEPLSKTSRSPKLSASYSFRTSDGTERFAKLEAFDTDNYKLTVFAKDGDQYEVPLASRCGSGLFAVQKGWKSPRAALPKFAIGDWDQLVISNLQEDPSYVSVKWAFHAGDLERGHFKRSESWRWTKPMSSDKRPDVGPRPAAGELVYLQFFQQKLDGTTLEWKGWAATSAMGVLTVGKGQPPEAIKKTYSSAVRCPSPVIHKVPPRPNFHGPVVEVVEDASGTPLKTSSSDLGFVVGAKLGHPFRAEAAPRSVCPTWYEVEAGLQRPFSFPS